MNIFAIETSCDETAAAVIRGAEGGAAEIISHAVYSQIDIHQQFGGIFPEAASREHVRKIGPIVEEAIAEAQAKLGPSGISQQDWFKQAIDVVAVTAGPGLIGSLLVGVNTAKTLAYIFEKPIVGVNHHEGHVMAAWIRPDQANEEDTKKKFQLPEFPAVALVVSGGHTKMLLMEGVGQFRELGRTRDDAVGEAFDKVARLLDLPYPGGPQISRLAAAYRARGEYVSLVLPRPMIDSGDYSFSFSGLKTAVARAAAVRGALDEAQKEEIAAAFEDAAVEVLVAKVLQAVREFSPASVVVAGGVAANRWLREQLATALTAQAPEVALHIPPPSLCTDNAAMIGAAALYRAVAGQVQSWYDVTADETLHIGV